MRKKLSRSAVSSSSNEMVYWSELPYDLILLITNQLLEVVDFLSFSAVCRSWRLVYLNKGWSPSHSIPWLMLSEYSEGALSIRRFLSLTRFKIYELPLPQAYHCRCWGTSHGWTVTLSQRLNIGLVNPITRACINLPQNSMLTSQGWNTPYWFAAIQKAVLLKVRDELVTMVIHGHNRCLAFAKHGDSAWTAVAFSSPVSLIDVACFQDKVWALTLVGSLVLINIEGPDCPRGLFIASPPNGEKGWRNLCLVESLGDLLLVLHYNHRWKVYKFNMFERKWMALSDLGNNSLFVDSYNCTSVSACGYFTPNCIYFAQENLPIEPREQQNITVYNIKDESTYVYQINANPSTRCPDPSTLYACPAWTTPTLW